MFPTYSAHHAGATERSRAWRLWSISLLGLLVGGAALAGQGDAFSGQWKLLERESLSGADYANGVPSEVKISVPAGAIGKDALTLERQYPGDNNTLVPMTTAYVAGTSAEAMYPTYRRNSRMEWQGDGHGFIEHSTIDPVPEGSGSHRDITVTWTLSGDGKTLTVVRDDKDVTKGEAFSMKGTYFRPTPVADGSVPGIHFEAGLSWTDVLAKASREHKPVFVDAYATWCGPCKEMDDHVYPLEPVGDFFNTHFISVRMQIDQTPKDRAEVKAGYADAAKLSSIYAITGFPTFLFFDPDGTPIHKAAGELGGASLIALGQNALTPEKQYYTQIRQFKAGVSLPISELKSLARLLKDEDLKVAEAVAAQFLQRASASERADPDAVKFIEEFSKSEVVAALVSHSLESVPDVQLLQPEYLDLIFEFREHPAIQQVAKRCLGTLSHEQKYTKDGIRMMISALSGPSGPEFEAFLHDGEKLNAIWGSPTFSQGVADYWIAQSEVAPRSPKDGGTPSFKAMHASIAKKFGAKVADRVVLPVQVTWYQDQKQWPQYCDVKVRQVDRLGAPSGNFFDPVNNAAWEVFSSCSDKRALNAALGWMSSPKEATLTATDLGRIDTYANLLYKAGRTEEALQWEGKAVAAEIEKAAKEKREPEASFAATLEKMKKGEPTWPTT